MSFQALLVLLVLIASAFGKESFSCSFCNSLVENAQTLVGKNEQEILSILEVVSETLCSELTTDHITPNQCKTGIRMYGPYIVELLSSGMEDSQVCGQIGLCDMPEKYTILWPSSIDQNGISYSTTDHLKKSSTQLFKFFLGDYSSLEEENYSLFTTLKGFTGTSISIKLTNNVDFVETQACEEGKTCLIKTSKPGRRVWCYITLDSENETDFQLDIVEKNAPEDVKHQPKKRNPTRIIIFGTVMTLLVTCLICCTITKCIFKKRREMRAQSNIVFHELMENPQLMMVFMPSEGGYVPAYAPVTIPHL